MHRGAEGHNPFARAPVQGKKADARCTDSLLAAVRARRSYAVAVILLACLMLLAGSKSPLAAAPSTVLQPEVPQQQVELLQQAQKHRQLRQEQNLEAQQQYEQRRRQRQQQHQQQDEQEQQQQEQEQEEQQRRQLTRGRGGRGKKRTVAPRDDDSIDAASPTPPRRRPRSRSRRETATGYDDVARMVVQVYGWHTFDGFSDDPSEQMLVVQPGPRLAPVVPPMWREQVRVRHHYAHLLDFPSAEADVSGRGASGPELLVLLQSIPERVDVTSLVFHGPTLLTASSATSLAQLSRVTQVLTSLALKDEERWCVLLKRAGYQLVSEDSLFKTWELVRRRT